MVFHCLAQALIGVELPVETQASLELTDTYSLCYHALFAFALDKGKQTMTVVSFLGLARASDRSTAWQSLLRLFCNLERDWISPRP